MDAGTLVIKAVLDSKGIRSELKDLESQIKQEEKSLKDFLTYKVQLETDVGSYEEVIEALKEIDDLKKQGETSYQGIAISEIEPRLIEAKDLWEKINGEIEDSVENVKNLRTQLNIRKQILSVQDSIKDMGKEIGKSIKSIARMGLAVLGIRGAFSMIRSAISQITSENEQLKTQLDFMKYALANAIKPIVEFLVKMLYKIMVFIGGLIKFFTGKNIFSKTLAQDFASANKSAKELRKTLAGFDEVNVLNKNGSVSALGGIDLSGIGNLHKEVEEMGNSIKRWFLGGDTIQEGFTNSWELSKQYFINTFTPIASWFNENVIIPIKTDFINMSKIFEPIWKPFKQGFIDAYNHIKETLKPFIDWFNTNIFTKLKEKWNEFKTEFLKAYASFINKIIDAINRTFGIFGVHIDYIETDSEEAGESLEENIVGALDEISSSASEISQTDYKVNFVTSSVDKVKTSLSDIWGYLTGLTTKKWNISAIFGGSTTGGSWAKGGIYYPQLPRLAVGGIVNQPGRGVPYHGAIIGERGAEGILPLTDSQQMELLGQAIGRYITINNTNPIYMNGRLIAKEINRSNAEDDFAFNR